MKHHGVVMDCWIEKLVGAGESLVPSLTEYMSEFLREVEPRLMESQEDRHAKHFAFVYAAGAYAIEQKLLPWKNNAFKKAVLRCHAQSLNNLRNGRSGLPLVLAKFKARLYDNDRVTPWPKAGKPRRSDTTDGWVKRSKTEKSYYIVGERLRSWFSSSGELSQVLSHLSRAGLLRTAGTGKTKDIRTANSKKVKCYQIVVPKAFEWETMGA